MRAFRRMSMAVLAIYAFLVVAPVVAFLVFALHGGVTTETWTELWRQTSRTGLLFNSLTLAGLTAVAALLIGVPLGYVFARTDMPGRPLLMALCAAPLFLPPFLWATACQAGLRAHGMSGMAGALIVMTLSLFPIVALLSAVGFAHIDPVLEEDARTVAGEAQVFRYTTFPLARPLILTGSLLVFILTIGEFGVPALMQVNVYPIAIYTAFSAFYDFGQAAVLCLPLVVATAIPASAAQRITRDVDFASLAEQWQPRRIALGRKERAVITTLVAGLLMSAIAVPMCVLVSRSDDPNVWQDARGPLLLSLALSATAATVVTFLGLLVAWLCQRSYARGGRWWLQIQILLFAIPGTVVGLGLVSLWNRTAFGWLYGTSGMIVLGYVARFAPLVVRAFEAFLAQVPRECEEAVWVDGGGPVVTFLRFILPVSRRAAALLWAMSFVLCMGELATTILVSPPGVQTLVVRLFTIEANAPQSRTASLALVLLIGCFTPLLLCGFMFKRSPKNEESAHLRARRDALLYLPGRPGGEGEEDLELRR
jgi:iron(III) transport system permease protein